MVEPIILPNSALIQSKFILQWKSKGLENFFNAFQVDIQGHRDLWADMQTHSQAAARTMRLEEKRFPKE